LPRPEAAPPERDSWFTDEAPGRSGERSTRVDKRSLLVPISLGVAVAAPSKHKEAAFDFVKYLTGPEGAKIMALVGRQNPALAPGRRRRSA